MYNNWVHLERYETQLVKATDNCNFYANMIVHYEMPAVQESLAKGIPAIIEQTQQIFDEMQAIITALEPNDLEGVTKDEVGQLVNGVN